MAQARLASGATSPIAAASPTPSSSLSPVRAGHTDQMIMTQNWSNGATTVRKYYCDAAQTDHEAGITSTQLAPLANPHLGSIGESNLNKHLDYLGDDEDNFVQERGDASINDIHNASSTLGDIIKPDDGFSFVEVIRQFISKDSSKFSPNEVATVQNLLGSQQSSKNSRNLRTFHDIFLGVSGNKFPEASNSDESTESDENQHLDVLQSLDMGESERAIIADPLLNDFNGVNEVRHKNFIPFGVEARGKFNLESVALEMPNVGGFEALGEKKQDSDSFKFPAKNWRNVSLSIKNKNLIDKENETEFHSSLPSQYILEDSIPDITEKTRTDNNLLPDASGSNSKEFFEVNSDQIMQSYKLPVQNMQNLTYPTTNLVKPVFQSSLRNNNAESFNQCVEDDAGELSNSSQNQAMNSACAAISNQSSRSAMSSGQRLDATNLYLTGFGSNFSHDDLECLLNDFKPIMSYRIINGETDHGIAFARLKTPDMAAKAVQQLNGTWFSKSKKMLRVKLANKQLPRSATCLKFQQKQSMTSSTNGQMLTSLNQQDQALSAERISVAFNQDQKALNNHSALTAMHNSPSAPNIGTSIGNMKADSSAVSVEQSLRSSMLNSESGMIGGLMNYSPRNSMLMIPNSSAWTMPNATFCSHNSKETAQFMNSENSEDLMQSLNTKLLDIDNESFGPKQYNNGIIRNLDFDAKISDMTHHHHHPQGNSATFQSNLVMNNGLDRMNNEMFTDLWGASRINSSSN
ncbi:MAG: hypothetical protein MHMPM18_001080 [Marteilia pararefringens]